MIKLERPLVFFDIESTGLDVQKDQIIELSLLKVTNDGKDSVTHVFDVDVPIEQGATEVHGFSKEDLAGKPKFKDKAKEIVSFIKGCDLAGFNIIRFDVPLLYHEFVRAGVDFDFSKVETLDVGNLYKIFNPRTLENAVKDYLDREHTGAHGAEADTEATYEVFKAMWNIESEMKESLSEIALQSAYGNKTLDIEGKFVVKDGEILLNFGKNKGQKASENLDYLDWMLRADFSEDTKRVARSVINPEPEIKDVVTPDSDDDDDDLPF